MGNDTGDSLNDSLLQRLDAYYLELHTQDVLLLLMRLAKLVPTAL